MKQKHPVDKALVCLIIAGWGYEVTALSTGLVPTLTELCHEYPWAEALIIGALLTHFHWKLPEVAADAVRRDHATRLRNSSPVFRVALAQSPPGAIRVASHSAEGNGRRNRLR